LFAANVLLLEHRRAETGLENLGLHGGFSINLGLVLISMNPPQFTPVLMEDSKCVWSTG